MNEWLMVGIIVTATLVAIGGSGFVASLIRGRSKSKPTAKD